MAVTVSHQKIVPHLPTFGSPSKVRWITVHRVMSPVSSLLTLPSGTTAPAVAWSSGSMRVCYVRKAGGCRDFLFQTVKWRLRPKRPDLMLYSYWSDPKTSKTHKHILLVVHGYPDTFSMRQHFVCNIWKKKVVFLCLWVFAWLNRNKTNRHIFFVISNEMQLWPRQSPWKTTWTWLCSCFCTSNMPGRGLLLYIPGTEKRT
jgi:hypothetical protein